MNGAVTRRRWTVQILSCGRCRKPRGVRHTCLGRFGRTHRRTRIRPQVRVRCKTCDQRRSPFALHTCMIRSDFKKRSRRHKAARRRARETAARRLRREKEKAAVRARRAREIEGRRLRREREEAERRARRARERKRYRRAAEIRKATSRSERTRKPASVQPAPRQRRPDYHPYDQCRDDECPRKACVAYRQGVEDCPLPHGAS